MKGAVKNAFMVLMLGYVVITSWFLGSCAYADDHAVDVRFVGGLVAENFGAVVAELGRDGFIPNAVVVATRPSPAEQLFLGKPMPGGAISADLGRYLCDLNHHVCAVSPKGTITWSNTTSTRATDKTDCNAGKLDLDELCFPVLTINTYPTSINLEFNGEVDDLKEKMLTINSCIKFDDACVAKLVAVNPGLDFNAAQRGKIIGQPTIRFPVLAYRLRLSVDSEAKARSVVEKVNLLAHNREQAGKFDKHNANIYVTQEEPKLNFQSKWQAVSGGEPQNPQQAIVNMQSVLTAMGYPWVDAQTRKWFDRAVPVAVGIWDMPVDTDHCYFNAEPPTALHIIVKNDKVGDWGSRVATTRATCGTSRDAVLDDHGTFVAGIISGIDRHGPALAVNPKANLWIHELSANAGGDANVQDDPVEVAWEANVLAEVINISMSDPSFTSQFAALIMGVGTAARSSKQDQVLFIAAAGNDGLQFDSEFGCYIFPACWSSDQKGKSVISVIGLRQDGKDLLSCLTQQNDGTYKNILSTNYGKAFDVAAVGLGWSSLANNAFGIMCGTSVATPYVTGLASLLISRSFGQYPRPEDIKERILVTADVDDALDDKIRFGRINFRRALEFESDWLMARTPVCDKTTSSCPVSVYRRRPLNIGEAWEDGSRHNPFQIQIGDIRRIVRESADSADGFRLIYSDTGKLRILRHVKFSQSSALKFKVKVNGSYTDKEIGMEEIEDFTPCGLTRACLDGR